MSPTEIDTTEILEMGVLRFLSSDEFLQTTQKVGDEKKIIAFHEGGVPSEEITADSENITHADSLTMDDSYKLKPDLKYLVYVNFLGDYEDKQHVTIESIPFPAKAILRSIEKYALDHLRAKSKTIYVILTNYNSDEILVLEIPPLSNTGNITIDTIKEFRTRKKSN